MVTFYITSFDNEICFVLCSFIATYRNESQLMHVEKIDVAYNLKATASTQLSKSKAETKGNENAVILPDSQPPSK